MREDLNELVFNGRPDLNDPRDRPFMVEFPGELPGSVNNQWVQSPIQFQGRLGSCVGFATAAAFEMHRYVKALNDKRADITPEYVGRFSPLYLYYEARKLVGWESQDKGSYIRDAVKVLRNKGVSLEKYWPYNVSKFSKNPPWYADICARFFRISVYERHYSLRTVKKAIASTWPVIGGWMAFDGVLDTGNDGVLELPGSKTLKLGGHATLFCGYDDQEGVLIFKNSWGTSWGRDGYGKMPYSYFKKYGYSFWSIR